MRMELQLLREQPVWVLIMRNDPLALANQVDAFELAYRKLLVAEAQCRNISIALCVLFFPVGLLTLIGHNSFGVRPRPMSKAASVCLVLAIILTIVAFIFQTSYLRPIGSVSVGLLVRSLSLPWGFDSLSSPFFCMFLFESFV